MNFIYICRQPGLGPALPALFWKPVQNINRTCTLWTEHQPREAPLPRRFCGRNQLEIPLLRRLNFHRFLMKSVAFPLVHFFRNFFPSFLPLFSLVRSPKNRNATLSLKMQHLRGPFRTLRPTPERPSLSRRNDEPEPPAGTVQNWRRPRIFARPRKPTCTYERIPNGDELSYDSTNDSTAAGPQSELRQRRWQLPLP